MRSILLAAALAVAPAAALAHAMLDHAEPKVGSRVAVAPNELRLIFDTPVKAEFSQVRVQGPPGFGGGVDLHADPKDARILVVPLRRPAPAGLYTVRWRAVCEDTHVTHGTFQITVGP